MTMDRRALLKRLGMAGLAIPAAMAVESRLVLPANASTVQALREVGLPGHVYDGEGYVHDMTISMRNEIQRFQSMSSLHTDFLAGPRYCEVELHMVLDGPTIAALDAHRGDKVHFQYFHLPLRSVRLGFNG